MQSFRRPSLGRNANHRSKYPCASVQHLWIRELTGEAMTPRHCSKSGNSRSPIGLAILALTLPRRSHHRHRLFHLFHQWLHQRPLQHHPHKLQRVMRFLHDQSLLLRHQRMMVFHHDPNLLLRLSKTTRSQLNRGLLRPLQRRNVLNLLRPLFDPALQILQLL